MSKLINSFRRDEDGPAMVEYGLLVGRSTARSMPPACARRLAPWPQSQTAQALSYVHSDPRLNPATGADPTVGPTATRLERPRSWPASDVWGVGC
jgi:hypothetical protein